MGIGTFLMDLGMACIVFGLAVLAIAVVLYGILRALEALNG